MKALTRHFLLWYGLLETFVFTGNILGWTALHYMLRQEGIYSSVCEDDPKSRADITSTWWNATRHRDSATDRYLNVTAVQTPQRSGLWPTCEEQDRLLNLAYTIGSFCMGSTSFIWGFLLDKWGLRAVRLVINGLITSGCILLSLTIKETSFLLFPSLILMCLAGVPLRLANMQIADLFPEKRSTIITLYSGAFSASASVFVFIKYGFDYGLPWEWACFLLAVLSALMLPVTIFLLPADRIREEKAALFAIGDKELSTVAPCVWGTFTYILDDAPFNKSVAHRDKHNESEVSKAKIKAAEANAQLPCEEKPLRNSLLSASYLLHQYWFCWLILYTIIYVGTLHLWLERIPSADPGLSSVVSEVYGLFQVSGLFLAPIGGMFMDWSIRRVSQGKGSNGSDTMLRVIRSCFWPMFLTTALEAVAQICKFFDDTLAVYISIVAVSLLRAFFLSIGTAYIRIRFPAEHFNKLLGIMSTFSAVASLLQFPLFLWESSSPRSVLYVNIFDSFCLAVAFIHPLLLVVTPIQRYFLSEKDPEKKTSQTAIKS